MSESPSVVSLKLWLQAHGGGFNPKALFQQDRSGSCVVAQDAIQADSTIVSCPFDLVITEGIAKTGVLGVLEASADEAKLNLNWSERQWISTYLALHQIIDPQDTRSVKLLHRPYLDTLPKAENLRTPLHFTPSELDIFKGTNLYGATLDREREWRAEWDQCRNVVSQCNENLGQQFTWEQYLTAATYLSSRAFPSSLLSPTPTLVHSEKTQPVLIPGVDALNHARGQPVSWSVSFPDGTQLGNQNPAQPTISLIIHSPTEKGQELFNNYGPKPNSEFILGYGFSMPNNPDDTIVLKIGGIGGSKWEVGRRAQGAEGLWNEILSTLVEAEGQAPTYDDVLDASGMLGEMVENLLARLPDPNPQNEHELRSDVVAMFRDYLEGQNDILSSLLEYAQERAQDAVKMAQDEGIELVLE